MPLAAVLFAVSGCGKGCRGHAAHNEIFLGLEHNATNTEGDKDAADEEDSASAASDDDQTNTGFESHHSENPVGKRIYTYISIMLTQEDETLQRIQ